MAIGMGDMEHQKKKNDDRQSRRNVFVLIAIILILLLLWGLGFVATMPIDYGYDRGFNQTATSIFATNNAVATLLEQTDVAGTEKSNATSTAIWTSIVSTSLAATERVNLTLTAAEKN